jgi:hypothetical protein
MDRGSGRTVVDDGGIHAGSLTNVGRAKGRDGGVLDFNGAGWVRVGNPGRLDSTRTFTWTAWIRTTDGGTILARTGPGRNWAQGGKSFFVRNGKLTWDVGWVGTVQSQEAVNDGAWHHVALTVRDGNASFYIDGRPSGGRHLNVGRFPEAGFPVKIGYGNENFRPCGFKGQIDDVRWYAAALDAKTVQRLARETDGDAGPVTFMTQEPVVHGEAPEAAKRAVEKVAPGWAIRQCNDDANLKPGFRAMERGMRNVLVTHPLDRDTPCILSRKAAIPGKKKTVLCLVVGHHPDGDWDLIVRVEGQDLLRKTVGKENTRDTWMAVNVDLSAHAGKTVLIELCNQPTGWSHEAGYWAKIGMTSR